MNRINPALAALVLLLGGATQAAADVVTTIPYWDHAHETEFFGYPNTATYGQTVTTPVDGDTQLNAFSFEINVPAALLFQGYVYAWNGTQATGSALYQSPTTHTPGNGFDMITFNTGGVNLSPGLQYVLFASISNNYAADQGAGDGAMGAPFSDAYSGGQFVYINNGGDTSQWTSTGWATNFLPTGGDLAFQANFGVLTPEPSSLILCALGIVGFLLAAFCRRRRPI